MTNASSRALAGATKMSKVLFIDSAVMHTETLSDGRVDGMEVYRLETGRSALGQIADALRYRRDIGELRILSHGEPGALMLGGTRIDEPALASNRTALDAIAATLADDATAVLYGCSIAANETGQAFVQALELALGARVAAASGPVAATDSGGNTVLDLGGGNTLTLVGVTTADLQNDWFTFR